MGYRVVCQPFQELVCSDADSGDVGAGTSRPIGLTYSDLLRWKYIINYNDLLFSSISSATANSDSTSVYVNWDIPSIIKSGPAQVDERSNVCGSGGSYTYSVSDYNSGSNASWNMEVDASVTLDNFDIGFGGGEIARYAGLYYPLVEIGITAAAHAFISFVDDPLDLANIYANASLSSLTDGNAPVTICYIFGEDIPLYGIASDSNSGTFGPNYIPPSPTPIYANYDASVDIGEFTITANAYWPYATTGGDPVYNTSSGAVINDPFS